MTKEELEDNGWSFTFKGCYKCCCKETNDIIKASEENSILEYELRCKSCDTLLNYWAYGYFTDYFIDPPKAIKSLKDLYNED